MFVCFGASQREPRKLLMRRRNLKPVDGKTFFEILRQLLPGRKKIGLLEFFSFLRNFSLPPILKRVETNKLKISILELVQAMNFKILPGMPNQKSNLTHFCSMEAHVHLGISDLTRSSAAAKFDPYLFC